MTDLEISKALALAIGHKPEDMFTYGDRLEVSDHAEVEDKPFDYLDWNVIGPIAAKYDCFPRQSVNDDWYVETSFGDRYADTPQKAIALAVIAGAKK